MLRRSWVCLQGLLGVLLLGATPAGAEDGPSGWLELDAGPAGEVHRLTPGGSADWAMEVRVPGEPAGFLEVALLAEPATSDVMRDFVSVELRTCPQPWDGGSCPEGMRVLMQATPLNSAGANSAGLNSAGALRVDLMEPGTSLSNGLYVMLTATLAQDVPPEVQGTRTRITLGVYGSGDNTGGGGAGGGAGSGGNAGSGGLDGQPARPPSNTLADTGARLGGYALLGFVAVATGFGLARLQGARR